MTDPKPATPAIEPVCDWCGAYKSRHMDAYYYGFSATESPEVDRILCSVARAGKGCHHTESWNEYGYVEKIQDAAIACAARIAADEETIKAERASADKYEAESEQKGADLMAAESVIAEQAEDIEALRTAFGLLSTLAPKVVMAPASPAEVVATAKEIHKSVSEEIEKLKAERVEK